MHQNGSKKDQKMVEIDPKLTMSFNWNPILTSLVLTNLTLVGHLNKVWSVILQGTKVDFA